MRYTTWLLLVVLFLAALLLSACQPNIETEAELEETFQAALDDMISKNENIHSAVMMVQGADVNWKGAAGLANPDTGIEMLPDDQFRSASAAKMMLATLVMKLSEAGLINLDSPIADYLAEDIVAGLHLYVGQDYSSTITTRQLLQHTSGLADDWFDERDNGRFLQMVLEDETDKLWEPVELVAYVKENLSPLFAPGVGFNYSDVNYILAGLVIESVTDQPLHEVYREQLFTPLGMAHTYMEFREEPHPSIPGRNPAYVFYGETEYSSFRSLSADWAGGGLVSTTEDMTRFIRAFANDEIFAIPGTREAMFDWVVWEDGSLDYGLGVMQIKGKTLTIWGHLGVGQTFMFYWPEGNITLTGTMNQNEVQVGPLFNEVLMSIKSFRE